MIEDFNRLPREVARPRLHECLASSRWEEMVLSGRPYRDVAHLAISADIYLDQLTDEELVEAMRAHPRIGERGGDSPASSEREQSQAMQSSSATLTALASENRQYEERFGYVFLIFASGRTGDEILSELRRRITNAPGTELGEARRELRKIVQARLLKMLGL